MSRANEVSEKLNGCLINEASLKDVDIKLLGKEFGRVTASHSGMLEIPVIKARDAAKKGDEKARAVLLKDIEGRMKERDPKTYAQLLKNLGVK